MSDNLNREHAVFVNWIPPLVEILKAKGGSATPKELREGIAQKMKLKDSFLSERYEKSGQLTFNNQVYWAKQYLAWEKLVDTSKQGVWALTDEGWNAAFDYNCAWELVSKWIKIHRDARRKKEATDEAVDMIEIESDPAKSLSLLEIIKNTTPRGFEHLCGRLLREYDFEAIEITKGSYDDGIDGTAVLKLNPFVNMSVYFQCKRYDGTVPIARVREFIGVLSTENRGVDKGIFITTGTFPTSAYKLEKNNTALELIDGEKLVEMFEKVELGVKRRDVYDPDLSFFKQYTE
ncbi:MAG: restriction endonuclease [Oscillospiraceae bacterium]|nr:restriction endonuclease [Oscillospiraceae bacterium]